jgi:exoribonuclease R
MFKINVSNRSYKKFQIFETGSLTEVHLNNFNPIVHCLFNGDVFNYDEQHNKIELVHSIVRNSINIPCVLILKGKTYGKIGNKYLYQAIPDDKRLPICLVKFLNPNNFQKNIINKFILVSFNAWTSKFNSHPLFTLSNMIGNVDKLDFYYEYTLYSKCLNFPIKHFNDETINKLKSRDLDSIIEKMTNKYNVIDKTNNLNHSNEFIYAIDPIGSLDFDDAFSLEKINNEVILSIYISNVSLWMDELDLWDAFSKRISTIYLPDRKRPMLPNILSDNLCSLLAGEKRFAFCLEIKYNEDGHLLNSKFYNALIRVTKNFHYEQPELIYNDKYLFALEFINKINANLLKLKNSIKDSHDIVAYLMICINYFSSIELNNYKNGIFRSCKVSQNYTEEEIPNEIKDYITLWRTTRTQYVKFDDFKEHSILSLDTYVHISSPIRRLVDLLNMINIQRNLSMSNLSNKSSVFYSNWEDQLDYINTTMRLIRKVQVNCNILNMLSNDSNLLEKEFNGYVFEKLKKSDELYVYMIYIPELKISSRITTRFIYSNYHPVKCNLFIILNEANIKRKIRISINNE